MLAHWAVVTFVRDADCGRPTTEAATVSAMTNRPSPVFAAANAAVTVGNLPHDHSKKSGCGMWVSTMNTPIHPHSAPALLAVDVRKWCLVQAGIAATAVAAVAATAGVGVPLVWLA